MTYTRTYNYDFSLDQNKNQESVVWSAINNPEANKKRVSAMFKKITDDVKSISFRRSNAYGYLFFMLPRAKW